MPTKSSGSFSRSTRCLKGRDEHSAPLRAEFTTTHSSFLTDEDEPVRAPLLERSFDLDSLDVVVVVLFDDLEPGLPEGVPELPWRVEVIEHLAQAIVVRDDVAAL